MHCAKVGTIGSLCAECSTCAVATSSTRGAAGASSLTTGARGAHLGAACAESAIGAGSKSLSRRSYLGATSADRISRHSCQASPGAHTGISAEEKVLLAAPAHLFQQFVNSVEEFRSTAYKVQKALFSKELSAFVFTLDSGSETHLITLEDAAKLFGDTGVSNLKVIGVNGSSRAEFKGKLIIRVQNQESGEVYLLDLGYGHAMRELPDNLLSVALLIKSGAVVHFEQGASYFQAHSGAAKMPLHQDSGLFQLFGGRNITCASSPVNQKVASASVKK